jgi:O-6-methylguanine DNA methyltransferase
VKTESRSKRPVAAGVRSAVVTVGAASVRLRVLEDAVVGVELLPLGRRHREGGDLWDLTLAKAAFELREYLLGKRRSFTVRHQQEGTPFFMEAWKVLGRIPYGRLLTYGQVAELCGRPGAARAVGGAMGGNHLPLLVPCHRVVAQHGLGGYGFGPEWKRMLIGLERGVR